MHIWFLRVKVHEIIIKSGSNRFSFFEVISMRGKQYRGKLYKQGDILHEKNWSTDLKRKVKRFKN